MGLSALCKIGGKKKLNKNFDASSIIEWRSAVLLTYCDITKDSCNLESLDELHVFNTSHVIVAPQYYLSKTENHFTSSCFTTHRSDGRIIKSNQNSAELKNELKNFLTE